MIPVLSPLVEAGFVVAIIVVLLTQLPVLVVYLMPGIVSCLTDHRGTGWVGHDPDMPPGGYDD